MNRRRWGALALGTALALAGADGARADESLDQLKSRARSLIQELEREVQKARAERKALENERKALKEKPAPAPKVADATPPAPAEKPAETARKVDVLADEVERLKSAIVLPETKELKSIYGLGPAASKIYQQNRGLSIGGYGEAFYSRTVQDYEGTKDTADALRFVLYTGYKFSDRILLNTELEFEHATTASTVSASGGSVSLEFAYLDFLGWDYLNARAGLVLIPMGFINELHEPVYFHGVQRPEVERTIIPTTWRELGVGAFGSLPGDLQYRTYLTTSLNAEGFTSSGIRGGRQSGNRAIADSPAGSGRIDWTPSFAPGLLAGGSFFVGDTGQNEDFAGEQPSGLLAMGDVHVQYRWRGLELRGLYVFGSLGDAAQISRGNEATVGDRQQGWYLEGAYDLMPIICPDWTTQYVAPFFRYENFDPMESAPHGFTRDKTKDTELYTMGITYKPHPQVALKLDYRNFEQAKGNRADDFGVGLGFVF